MQSAMAHTPFRRCRQGIESTRSAFYSFKRLQYLMMQDPESLTEVTRLWEAREAKLQLLTATFSQAAKALLESDQPERACEVLDLLHA